MINNLQKPEGTTLTEKSLNIHSIFRTIQGEGPFCGFPAVFVRLAGCNLQCPGCDTDYTTGRHSAKVTTVLSDVQSLASDGLVVITGGEPFRQPIGLLITELMRAGYFVQVETNGTLNPSPEIQWNRWPAAGFGSKKGAYIVVSPKIGHVRESIWACACAVKYVLEAGAVNPDNGLPTAVLGHLKPPQYPPPYAKIPVYIQPADEHDAVENRFNVQAAVASCLEHGYILQIQIHKVVGVE